MAKTTISRRKMTATILKTAAAVNAMDPGNVGDIISDAIKSAIGQRYPHLDFSWDLVPTVDQPDGLGVRLPGQAWSSTLDVVTVELAKSSIIWDSNVTFDLKTLNEPLIKTRREIKKEVLAAASGVS